MSSVREFVSSWNDLMPFVPITEQELKSPNEILLRRWLIAILRQLKVKMDWLDSIDSESGNRLREMRIRLAAYVNHFFKVSNPRAKDKEFFYMDLIQPSKISDLKLIHQNYHFIHLVDYKKTFNVLRSILNYCAFVNHMINTTIVPANKELKHRDELLTTKNQLKAEIEQAKIREETNAAQIHELAAKIPLQKIQLRELDEEEQKYKAEMNKHQQESEDIDIQIGELRNTLKELQASIITDDECLSILNARKQLDAQCREQSQIAGSARQSLVEVSSKIKNASLSVIRIDKTLTEYSKSLDIKAHVNERKNVANLQTQVKGLKEQLHKIQAELTSFKQTKKCLEKTLDQAKKSREGYRSQYANKTNLKSEIKEKTEVLNNAKVEQQRLSNDIQKLQEDSLKLYRLTCNVLRHIEHQSYGNKRAEG